MSVQPVRLFGDPVLRTPAVPVTTFDAELRKLVADLTDTMHDEGGAGLAAPQLGVGPAGVHLRLRRVRRAPGQPDLRRGRRRGAARPGGLPVDPRAALGLPPAPARRRARLGPARRAGHRARAASCWPAASSTRPTTSTACCSSTGSTPRPASWRWPRSGPPSGSAARRPSVKVSPHPLFGKAGSAVRLVFAGTPGARPCRRCGRCSTRRATRWSPCVTRPDAPAGRGRSSVRSPVGALADEAGMPVLTPRRPREPEFLAALRELAPDCCPVVAYGALVPRAALDVPAHGWVNLHFSLLPAWRGAAPVQAAVRPATRSPARPRSCWRRAWTPARRSAWSPRPSAPPTPRATCSAGSPSPGPRCWSPPWTASPTARCVARPQPADGRLARPEGDRRRRPGGLGGAGRGGGPAGPLGHPRARGLDDVPRRAARARPGAAGRRAPDVPELKPGELRRREAPGARRHRDRRRWSWARCARSGKRAMPAPDWARGVRIESGELLA